MKILIISLLLLTACHGKKSKIPKKPKGCDCKCCGLLWLDGNTEESTKVYCVDSCNDRRWEYKN